MKSERELSTCSKATELSLPIRIDWLASGRCERPEDWRFSTNERCPIEIGTHGNPCLVGRVSQEFSVPALRLWAAAVQCLQIVEFREDLLWWPKVAPSP